MHSWFLQQLGLKPRLALSMPYAAALAATHEATQALSPLLILWAEEAAINPLLAKSPAT